MRIHYFSKRFVVPIIAIATLGTISGCTSYQSSAPTLNQMLQSETKQDGKTCIRQVDINGYGVLDDYAITVDVRGKKTYIATTMYRCNSLNTGFQAGFDGNNFDFCPVRDKIITVDEACPVKAIYEFDTRKEAFEAYEKAKAKRKELIEEAQAE